MNFYVVIPARYASRRLVGKPLLEVAGKSIIQRVYHQAQASSAYKVIVATDDGRIEAHVKEFGGEVIMTSSEHPSGTDRLQEVAEKLELKPSEIIVNVQGDEPLIPPEVIDQVAANLAQVEQASVATLCEPIDDMESFRNPNHVKVVYDKWGIAQYFSRAPIPWPRAEFMSGGETLPAGFEPQRHIGVYAYRVDLLNRYVTWPKATIEKWESLEQLRVLWQGEKIHVQRAVKNVPGGVDTEEDLSRLRKLFE